MNVLALSIRSLRRKARYETDVRELICLENELAYYEDYKDKSFNDLYFLEVLKDEVF